MVIRKLSNIDELGDSPEWVSSLMSSTQIPARFKIKRFLNSWDIFLQMGIGVFIVAEKDGKKIGAIGGVAMPPPYSDETFLTQMFWWVQPEERHGVGLKLLNAFEEEAKSRKCSGIIVAYVDECMLPKVKKVYERHDFQPAEQWWYKRLDLP